MKRICRPAVVPHQIDLQETRASIVPLAKRANRDLVFEQCPRLCVRAAFDLILLSLRPQLQREPNVLKLGDLEVDLVRRRASRGGQRLDLTAQDFALLSALLRRRGEVLSRTVLTEQVWDMHFDSDSNVVEVAIRRLRAKLDDPHPVKLLHTVRGMGYVLEMQPEQTRDAR